MDLEKMSVGDTIEGYPLLGGLSGESTLLQLTALTETTRDFQVLYYGAKVVRVRATKGSNWGEATWLTL